MLFSSERAAPVLKPLFNLTGSVFLNTRDFDPNRELSKTITSRDGSGLISGVFGITCFCFGQLAARLEVTEGCSY